MQHKRSLLIGAGGGAIVVWIAAASTTNLRPPSSPIEVRSTAIDASGAVLASEVERLHERLRPSAVPMEARDLFRYAARTPAATAPLTVAPVVQDLEAPAAPAPSLLRLVGIAEDAGAGGPIRTAVLKGFGELFLVKEGDRVAARFTVVTIGSDAVELHDDRDETTLRIALQ